VAVVEMVQDALLLLKLNPLEHKMNWIPLNEAAQLDLITQHSHNKPQLLFKHSTRCSISVTVKSRLDAVTTNELIDCHYLDLLEYRSISNKISTDFNVFHESPQVLLIKNGECIYDESHLAIQWDEIEEQLV
jgi:bacillithiol system protein YtxJ